MPDFVRSVTLCRRKKLLAKSDKLPACRGLGYKTIACQLSLSTIWQIVEHFRLEMNTVKRLFHSSGLTCLLVAICAIGIQAQINGIGPVGQIERPQTGFA
ncbi:MAG: hypothetical protein AAB401_09250, partial [Acidobacteriota bacterium]